MILQENNDEMSKFNDITLIEEARNTPYTRWLEIDQILDKVTSQVAKNEILAIQRAKKWREEATNGDL